MAAASKTTSTSKEEDPAVRFRQLADHLQLARRSNKLSIRKVSQLTNLPESTIRALENPRKSDLPSSNVLGLYKVYAAELGVPASKVTKLAGRDEKAKPELRLKRLPKLKNFVVFSHIGTAAVVVMILIVVAAYAAIQGFGLIAAPSLQVALPTQEYTVVDESAYEVRGSADREATVLINGAPTTVNSESGDFAQIIFLQPGYNYVTVEVINSFSTSTVRNFIIIYRPSTLPA